MLQKYNSLKKTRKKPLSQNYEKLKNYIKIKYLYRSYNEL